LRVERTCHGHGGTAESDPPLTSALARQRHHPRWPFHRQGGGAANRLRRRRSL